MGWCLCVVPVAARQTRVSFDAASSHICSTRKLGSFCKIKTKRAMIPLTKIIFVYKCMCQEIYNPFRSLHLGRFEVSVKHFLLKISTNSIDSIRVIYLTPNVCIHTHTSYIFPHYIAVKLVSCFSMFFVSLSRAISSINEKGKDYCL